MTRTALVCGAGGFIGSHLVRRLKQEGYWVRGADLHHPEYWPTAADQFVLADLRREADCADVIDQQFDEVYQLAADMGGAGYVFTGTHDADIMSNSVRISVNVLEACKRQTIQHIFYASSACIYPAHNQEDPDNPDCSESSAYPAAPDSEYGWEKLFCERLFLAHNRNYGMRNRIARFHNIFGPMGTWQGGREKAPAAVCRKIAEAINGGEIEIWGDGGQTRSFLYIDECVEGIRRLMASDFEGPVNIGSDEMVTINQMVDMVSDIAGKTIHKRHVPGPVGVRGRNSDNRLVFETLGWRPDANLRSGLERTYDWIETQIRPDQRQAS